MIRPVRAEDMPAIAAIYADAVLSDTASFELEAPDAAEMERRCQALGDAYPYLVLERDGVVVGYAYTFEKVGFKFDRWCDVVMLQRAL